MKKIPYEIMFLNKYLIIFQKEKQKMNLNNLKGIDFKLIKNFYIKHENIKNRLEEEIKE